MGCFDTVLVPCPTCGENAKFQSKGGACRMRTFTLETAPDDVMTDVNRHAPYTCACCGTMFEAPERGSIMNLRRIENMRNEVERRDRRVKIMQSAITLMIESADYSTAIDQMNDLNRELVELNNLANRLADMS